MNLQELSSARLSTQTCTPDTHTSKIRPRLSRKIEQHLTIQQNNNEQKAKTQHLFTKPFMTFSENTITTSSPSSTEFDSFNANVSPSPPSLSSGKPRENDGEGAPGGLMQTDIQSDWEESIESFEEMGLPEVLLRGVYAYGFEKPSAIQQRAIKPVMLGHDLIAQAQSGSVRLRRVPV